MKRFHVHLQVKDLADSIRFYSALFGTEPAKVKHDYAKWMLDDPRVNFAISTSAQKATGLSHLGIQVDSEEELEAATGNAARAANSLVTETDVTCCYARSDKAWVEDPQGVRWETFLTHGDATSYGFSADDSKPVEAEPEAACAPGGCGCAPKETVEKPKVAACC
ncbi:MAG TPA: ArsI/CadI family heavy metal resistance metalloenzyme [Micropepsaceae bacterium]|nr:ArsI/CadI family heavy metal resistance metalloenzyme [Micropepsaceae bacterium]